MEARRFFVLGTSVVTLIHNYRNRVRRRLAAEQSADATVVDLAKWKASRGFG
jgi:hypothetical protein